MGFDFSVIFNTLTQSPGDLISFLVVSLFLILILVIAISRLRKTENRSVVHHVMTGCGILLFLQSIIYISSFFSPNDLTKTTMIFTIIECLAGTLMIAWLTWTFLVERDQFLFNGLIIFLSSTLILAGVGSFLWIILLPDANLINSISLIIIWQYGSLILILAGLIVIMTIRPKQWIVAAAILVVLAAGLGLQLIFQNPNSFQMGAVRLSQLLSLPWMLFLIHRFRNNFRKLSTKKEAVKRLENEKRVDTKPTLMDQLLKISLQETPESKYKAAVRAISFSVAADMCYLAKITDKTENIQLLAGYDLIRERFLPIRTLENWGKDTVNLFDEIKGTLSEVVFYQRSSERLNAELDQSTIDRNRLQDEKKTLTQVLIEKQLEINNKESSIKQLKARLQIEKIATVKQIEQLQKEISALINQAAKFKRNASKCQDLHKEIDHLTKERDHLQKELMLSNTRIKELETKSERIDPIQLAMETKIISLDAIAANIKLQTAPQVQQKHLNLEIINPDGRQMIKTDPEILHTALIRLMENAIQASKEGGKIQLSLKLSFETGMLILDVTDFGEGLSQTEQRVLFNTDRDALPGIGSIKSIQDAVSANRLLKGKIWLKSKKKVFTTFRIQVPVRIID